MDPKSNTQILSAVGYGYFVPLFLFNPAPLPPGFLCILSPGAVLTYAIEVTGDDVTVPGYNPVGANVNFADNFVSQSASANGYLNGCIMAIRPRILTYTSGLLTFQIIQVGL